MIFNFRSTKDAKTLAGVSLSNDCGGKGIPKILSDFGLMEIGSMIDFHNADGQDFIARLAVAENGKIFIAENGGERVGYVVIDKDLNYLPLTGGTLNGGYTPLILNNSANTGGALLGFNTGGSALGYFGFYGNSPVFMDTGGNYKDILHTGNMADHVLPLNGGGTVQGSGSAPLTIRSWASSAYLNFENITEEIVGALGFSGVDTPVFVNSAYNKMYQLLHTGNSAKVHIQSTAPSDTSSLWVY